MRYHCEDDALHNSYHVARQPVIFPSLTRRRCVFLCTPSECACERLVKDRSSWRWCCFFHLLYRIRVGSRMNQLVGTPAHRLSPVHQRRTVPRRWGSVCLLTTFSLCVKIAYIPDKTNSTVYWVRCSHSVSETLYEHESFAQRASPPLLSCSLVVHYAPSYRSPPQERTPHPSLRY